MVRNERGICTYMRGKINVIQRDSYSAGRNYYEDSNKRIQEAFKRELGIDDDELER